MFPVTNIFYFFIPALPAISTLAALLRSGTQHASCAKPFLVFWNNTWRVRPAVRGFHVYHRRWEPDNQIRRCTVQVVLYPRKLLQFSCSVVQESRSLLLVAWRLIPVLVALPLVAWCLRTWTRFWFRFAWCLLLGAWSLWLWWQLYLVHHLRVTLLEAGPRRTFALTVVSS